MDITITKNNISTILYSNTYKHFMRNDAGEICGIKIEPMFLALIDPDKGFDTLVGLEKVLNFRIDTLTNNGFNYTTLTSDEIATFIANKQIELKKKAELEEAISLSKKKKKRKDTIDLIYDNILELDNDSQFKVLTTLKETLDFAKQNDEYKKITSLVMPTFKKVDFDFFKDIINVTPNGTSNTIDAILRGASKAKSTTDYLGNKVYDSKYCYYNEKLIGTDKLEIIFVNNLRDYIISNEDKIKRILKEVKGSIVIKFFIGDIELSLYPNTKIQKENKISVDSESGHTTETVNENEEESHDND